MRLLFLPKFMIWPKVSLKAEQKEILIIVRQILFQAKLYAENVVVFTVQRCGIRTINTEELFGNATTNLKTKRNAKLLI